MSEEIGRSIPGAQERKTQPETISDLWGVVILADEKGKSFPMFVGREAAGQLVATSSLEEIDPLEKQALGENLTKSTIKNMALLGIQRIIPATIGQSGIEVTRTHTLTDGYQEFLKLHFTPPLRVNDDRFDQEERSATINLQDFLQRFEDPETFPFLEFVDPRKKESRITLLLPNPNNPTDAFALFFLDEAAKNPYSELGSWPVFTDVMKRLGKGINEMRNQQFNLDLKALRSRKEYKQAKPAKKALMELQAISLYEKQTKNNLVQRLATVLKIASGRTKQTLPEPEVKDEKEKLPKRERPKLLPKPKETKKRKVPDYIQGDEEVFAVVDDIIPNPRKKHDLDVALGYLKRVKDIGNTAAKEKNIINLHAAIQRLQRYNVEGKHSNKDVKVKLDGQEYSYGVYPLGISIEEEIHDLRLQMIYLASEQVQRFDSQGKTDFHNFDIAMGNISKEYSGLLAEESPNYDMTLAYIRCLYQIGKAAQNPQTRRQALNRLQRYSIEGTYRDESSRLKFDKRNNLVINKFLYQELKDRETVSDVIDQAIKLLENPDS